MKKRRNVVAGGAIATVVAVFGVGYGVAVAQDEPRDGGQRAPEFGQMKQLHERMVRDPQVRRVHKQMTRMHQMMGGGMGMPGRGSSEMGRMGG